MRRSRLALAAAALATIASTLLPAGVATGATPNLAVRGIDATDRDAVKLTFMWSGDPADLSKLSLRESGVTKTVTDLTDLDKTDTHLGTVAVVDVSGSMNDDGTLAAVKKGLAKMATSLPEGDQLALVSYNDTAVVESDLTDDVDQLTSAIDGLGAPRDGKTATYDALRKANALFEKRQKLQPNVVLITDGTDDRSTASLDTARGALVGSGAALHAVELGHDGKPDFSGVNSIVDRTGGAAFTAATTAAVPNTFADLSTSLRSQYVATYASTATQGSINVSLSLNGIDRKASYVAGSSVRGAATTAVVSEDKAFGPSWLHGKMGGLLGLGLVGLAVGLGAFALASLAGRTDESLTAVLRPYADGPQASDENDGALAQTAILQRAVELTEEFAERQGFLVKVERALERADLPLRAAEALFFYGAGVVIITLGAFALGGPVMGMFVLFLGGMLPPAAVNFLAARRGKAFNASLPDTLQLLSGSLRAGYSLLQGVEAVSNEVGDPMGKELRRVITEARLGREVEDAMEAVAERMASPDFAWAVMAVRIQREVGGNLSELLLTVSDTMVHRERLRRDVAALTAEGKISAIILGLLPIGLGAFMWMSNPTYMHPLGSTGMGQGLLAAAVVSGLIGFAWMKKTINIQI